MEKEKDSAQTGPDQSGCDISDAVLYMCLFIAVPIALVLLIH